jgi:hypothetical protein
LPVLAQKQLGGCLSDRNFGNAELFANSISEVVFVLGDGIWDLHESLKVICCGDTIIDNNFEHNNLDHESPYFVVRAAIFSIIIKQRVLLIQRLFVKSMLHQQSHSHLEVLAAECEAAFVRVYTRSDNAKVSNNIV